MDILRCYKILELDHKASMDEAREAYIDMARVWHPDRFTDNPRLRNKAEEKLKEINIAYAEIKALLSTEPGTLRKKEPRWAQETFKATCGQLLIVKEIAGNLCSYAYSMLRETEIKQIFRNVSCPKIEPGGMANRKSQNNDSISRGAGRMDKNRDRHRKFADIYEEVAKAKKAEKKKMREMR